MAKQRSNNPTIRTSMQQLPNLSDITAGRTNTVLVPASGVLHGIYLYAHASGTPLNRAQLINDIGDIRVRVDGKLKIDVDAEFVLDDYAYWFDQHGAFTEAGVIPILLWRPNLPDAFERALLAWGTEDVESIALEVEILDTSAGTGTVDTVEVFIEVEDDRRVLGKHLCISQHLRNFATTGEEQVNTLPYGDKDVAILAEAIEDSTGTIDEVTVQEGQVQMYQSLPAAVNDLMLHCRGRTEQTGYYTVDHSKLNHRLGYLYSGALSSYLMSITWSSAAPNAYSIFRTEVRGLQSSQVA